MLLLDNDLLAERARPYRRLLSFRLVPILLLLQLLLLLRRRHGPFRVENDGQLAGKQEVKPTKYCRWKLRPALSLHGRPYISRGGDGFVRHQRADLPYSSTCRLLLYIPWTNMSV